MRKERGPNFIMVGAAKAGTTSIAQYLDEHPEIFVPEIKEPYYFIRDKVKALPASDMMRDIMMDRLRPDFESYSALFDQSNAKMKGEASVHYLYEYETVIPRIKEEFGDVHIIIVLRDPTKRAFSNYVFQKRVEFGSFEHALENENDKKEKGWNSFWLYKDQGNYFAPVKAYLDNFNNVHVCFFEDLQSDPKKFMSDMYRFLDVDPSFVPDIETMHNPTLVPANRFVKWLYYLKLKYRIRLGLPGFLKLRLDKATMKKKQEEINPETLKKLHAYYKPNILQLEQLVSRDLSDWYN